MRTIPDKYWIAFIAFKVVVLVVFAFTLWLPILAASLIASIPWYLYLFNVIGKKEK
jgi:hypothetical protein